MVRAVLLAIVILAVPAQGLADAAEHEPYRLMIRYGSPSSDAAGEATPSATFLCKARRIDVDVVPVDSGRIATHNAILSYNIDAPQSGNDISAGIALTYARAGGQSSVDTNMLLSRNRWLQLGSGSDSSGIGNVVYVRLERN